MDGAGYVALGVLLAAPILYIVNRLVLRGPSQPKQKDRTSFAYVSELNNKFDLLVDSLLRKDNATYQKLYDALEPQERKVFGKFVGARLEKGPPGEPVADPYQVAKWEVVRWVFSVFIESAVVLGVAYVLYLFLSSK